MLMSSVHYNNKLLVHVILNVILWFSFKSTEWIPWHDTKGKRWTMNVLKWSKQINYPGLRVMSLSLHQWCIIIILCTSYKSHIVSIVCPCWDEQGKLLGHHHGSTIDNLLGLGHFWQKKTLLNPRNVCLKQ